DNNCWTFQRVYLSNHTHGFSDLQVRVQRLTISEKKYWAIPVVVAWCSSFRSAALQNGGLSRCLCVARASDCGSRPRHSAHRLPNRCNEEGRNHKRHEKHINLCPVCLLWFLLLNSAFYSV